MNKITLIFLFIYFSSIDITYCQIDIKLFLCKDTVIVKGDTSFVFYRKANNEAPGVLTYKKEVFFDFDKHTIPNIDKLNISKSIEDYFNKLDSINKKIGIQKYQYLKPIKINLIGHTDFYGDTSYNIELSKKRVDFIKEYLTNKGFDVIKIQFYGEKKPFYKKTNKNRRVDVLIDYLDTWWGKTVDCEVDTIIKKIDKNDIKTIYEDKNSIVKGKVTNKEKENITFTPYITKPSIISNNLSTIDENGNTLLSGGMFEACNYNKRTITITVRFYTCSIDSAMSMYDVSQSNPNAWVKSKRPIKFGYDAATNMSYYETEITLEPSTCSRLNMDCSVVGGEMCSGCGDICLEVSDTTLNFLETKDILGNKLILKCKKGFHERSYMVHLQKKIALKSDDLTQKKHSNILVDSCNLKYNLVVSVAQKRGKSYLMVMPIDEIPYRKWLNFLFSKRFILKKKFYQEIKLNELEAELSKLIKD